jgi:hypothetical protein
LFYFKVSCVSNHQQTFDIREWKELVLELISNVYIRENQLTLDYLILVEMDVFRRPQFYGKWLFLIQIDENKFIDFFFIYMPLLGKILAEQIQ